MPRWAVVSLAALLALAVAAIVLNAIVVAALIGRVNEDHVQTCELYAVVRAEQGAASVSMPPGC